MRAPAPTNFGRGSITTINDLKDKRIAFSRGSVGEYFVYYTLSIARLNPRFDVTLVPADSVAEAVESFNAGQADAVSGWEPDIYDAEASGGISLLSSNQLRIVVDVVVTSRQSIADKADLVQNRSTMPGSIRLKTRWRILTRLPPISPPGGITTGAMCIPTLPARICACGLKTLPRRT